MATVVQCNVTREQYEFDRIYNIRFLGHHVDGRRLADCQYFYEEGIRRGRDTERRLRDEQGAETKPSRKLKR